MGFQKYGAPEQVEEALTAEDLRGSDDNDGDSATDEKSSSDD